MSPVHLADILKRGLDDYQQHYALNYQQARVCQHLQSCRTGKLGYQSWQCDTCGEIKQVGCSCRDRHCPRCQSVATAKWVETQRENLLACRYFHLVFTLPHELNCIAYANANLLYQSLFKAAWETLTQFATRKGHGQLGMTSVLHTWGQNLSQHIHLHCLIPAGGLYRTQWREIEKGYLYPVKALSKVFRGKMLAALNEHEDTFTNISAPSKWCVYSKACLTYSDKLVSYLARYTRKGVISESRLISVSEQGVCFKYRDYADNHKIKVMTLSCREFLRRYLQHVLPKGFMRIRHYGFLANACRKHKLALIKAQALNKRKKMVDRKEATTPDWTCDVCKAGKLRLKCITSGDKATQNEAMKRIRTS